MIAAASSGIRKANASETHADETRTDYYAKHCEIFVDRIGISGFGSYGSHSMVYSVKILPERLDGRVKNVGIRVKKYGTLMGEPYEGDWEETPGRLIGGGDYYQFYFSPGIHGTSLTYEGAFFVETDKGTRFWLNPAWENVITKDGNFILTGTSAIDAARDACRAQGGSFSTCFTAEAHTRTYGQVASVLNPGGCK